MNHFWDSIESAARRWFSEWIGSQPITEITNRRLFLVSSFQICLLIVAFVYMSAQFRHYATDLHTLQVRQGAAQEAVSDAVNRDGRILARIQTIESTMNDLERALQQNQSMVDQLRGLPSK